LFGNLNSVNLPTQIVKVPEFVLDKIEFENYLHYKEATPKRITIYTDNKYVGDKPIENNKK